MLGCAWRLAVWSRLGTRTCVRLVAIRAHHLPPQLHLLPVTKLVVTASSSLLEDLRDPAEAAGLLRVLVTNSRKRA